MTYGPPGQRFRLAGEPAGRASWAAWLSWALITAENPGGQRVTAHENSMASIRLRAELRARGLTYLSAVNGEGEWAEAACLVRDLPLGGALELARAFGQAALLWGVGRRAALIGVAPLQLRRAWVALLEQEP